MAAIKSLHLVSYTPLTTEPQLSGVLDGRYPSFCTTHTPTSSSSLNNSP